MQINTESFSNLAKQVLYYAVFCGLIWLTHLIIISFIAFFHFLLNHPLDIIESWVFAKGWEIITVTKFLAGYLMLRAVTLKLDSRQPLRDFFVNGFTWPKSEVFVIIVFLFTFFVFMGEPQKIDRTRLELLPMFASFFGAIMLYLVDIFIIEALEKVYPIKGKVRWLAYIIFPAMLLAISHQVFWYGEEVGFLVYFNFFICLIFWRWGKRNWSIPLTYICLFIGPLGILLGIDPIWGPTFSPLKVSSSLGLDQYIAILFVVSGYLLYRSKWSLRA